MPSALWLLAIGTFTIGTDAFVVAGILPDIAADLQVSVGAAGQLVTAYSLAYAALAPTIASLTRSACRRTVLVGALAAFILGNLVSAAADHYMLLLAGRILAAAGAASFTPLASAVAFALAPEERRARALAVIIAGFTVATALGIPLSTFTGAAFGWRATFAGTAGMAAIVLLGALALLPRLGPAGRSPLRGQLAELRNPAVALTLVVSLLAVTTEQVVYTYIVPALADVGHESKLVTPILLLILGIGAVSGNAIVGPAIERLGDRTVLLMSVAGMTVTLALLPLWSRALPTAVAAMFLLGMTGWMYPVPQQHRLLSLAGPGGPVIVSLNSSALYAGVALGGLLGGAVIHMASPQWLAAPAALLGVTTLLIAAYSYRATAPLGPALPASTSPQRDQIPT
ncbi:MFS transporter [Streptomyces sp. KR80]|uniref:MFS transporter n=1 Tax=Streptomyces sp. KR80 TaxID=3457426 RepID=UPI003FD31940